MERPQVATASSSTPAATLCQAEELPQIFLSHAGEQKGVFVTHLYHALLNAKHRPFFDKDSEHSLPIGRDYPSRIFQACRACKMGVVVLSEEYVTKLWPMLELQHLLTSAGDCLIYPLFYSLKPADLADPVNLKRWKACWVENGPGWQSRMQELQGHMSSASASGGSCDLQINLNIESWASNLRKLQYRSGGVRNVFHVDHERSFYESDYEYIQAIVSNICFALPSPRRFSLEHGVMGQARMQQKIAEVFNCEESMGGDGVRAIGVHGIGGSGKSTVSKLMLNFYGSEFPGRCFYLEFPTPGSGEDNNVAKLLQNMRSIILDPSHIDEAMLHLEEKLKRESVFLVIDNIWDDNLKAGCPCFQYAKRIMHMKYAQGSKIMVTSRSESIVRNLIQCRLGEHQIMGGGQSVVPVPSLTEEEAMQSLKSYTCFSSSIPEECLGKLARSCFFEGKCHPLYLKLKGAELEQKGRATFNVEHWRELISSLEVVHNTTNMKNKNFDMTPSEQCVLHVVEKSLDTLPSRRFQEIFIDLATCRNSYPCRESLSGYNGEPWEPPWSFLQFHYDECRTKEKMFYEVILVLEYHGLLELHRRPSTCDEFFDLLDWEQYEVVIHDLHKLVATSRVDSLPNFQALVKSSLHVEQWNEGLSPVMTAQELLNKRSLAVTHISARTWSLLFGSYSIQVQTQVMKISGFPPYSLIITPPKLVFTDEWKALGRLELYHIPSLKEITGWEGTPNLVWLCLSSMHDLQTIGSIGCLKRLERLFLEHCQNLKVQTIVGYSSSSLYLVKSGDQLPKLTHLVIRDSCEHLAEVGDVRGTFPSLARLRLESCGVERLPADQLNLGTLLVLQLLYCPKLRSIGDGGCSLSSLRMLWIKKCPDLERIPDLSNSTNLVYLIIENCASLRPASAEYWRGAAHVDIINGRSSNVVSDEESLGVAAANAPVSILSHLMSAAEATIPCNPESEIISEYRGVHELIAKRETVRFEVVRVAAQLHCGLRCRAPNFVNLKCLTLKDVGINDRMMHGAKIRWLDVCGMPSLEKLDLKNFAWVQKLSFATCLVKCCRSISLYNFPSLEEIRAPWGPGAVHSLYILHCPSLIKWVVHGLDVDGGPDKSYQC